MSSFLTRKLSQLKILKMKKRKLKSENISMLSHIMVNNEDETILEGARPLTAEKALEVKIIFFRINQIFHYCPIFALIFIFN